MERNGGGGWYGTVELPSDAPSRPSAHRPSAEAARQLARLEGPGVGTWEWNVQTGALHTTPRWAAIVGRTQADARAERPWGPGLHPDDRAEAEHALRRHLDGDDDAFVCEVRLEHADGGWVWVLERGRVLSHTDDGAPAWLVGTRVALPRRRREAEALARSEWLLNRTGAVARVGGWVLELADGYLTWTEQTRRIHGVPDTFVPRLETALEFYAPEGRPAIEQAVQVAMDGGGGWDLELPLIRHDGTPIWVRAVGEVECDAAGVPVRLLGAFQDITEPRAQRLAADRASRRMGLAATNAGVGVWEVGAALQRMHFDPTMSALFGRPHRRDSGTGWRERIVAADRERVLARMREAFDGRRFELDFQVQWPDGSVRTLHASADVLVENDAPRLVGVCWDVTEEQALKREVQQDRTRLERLSHQLREQHELMRITMESIGDGVVTTDAAGRTQWLNAAARRLTGWRNAEAAGSPIAEVLPLVEDGTTRPLDPVALCLATAASSVCDDGVLLARDGTRVGVEAKASPIRGDDGSTLGAVLVFRDVTQQRRVGAEMAFRATHDALTGLVNRSEFEARLTHAHLAVARGESHALLFVDLDQFKIVNDTCGHAAGDRLLQEVAHVLQGTVRRTDTLARLGGDEFGLILDRCHPPVAARIAQSICERLDAVRFVHEDRTFRIGASVGLVQLDDGFDDVAAALQAADASCYAAKEAGRNRVHTWRPGDAEMLARQGETRWAQRIAQALDDDAFELHGQRIVGLGPGCADRTEVLLRMVDPDGALVLPGAFLPAAERFGLAPRVDAWVLRRVVDFLEHIGDGDDAGVLHVNLSGQSLGDPAFHARALQLLDATGLPTRARLCVEVTETAAITNMARAERFLAQLRALGVQVALDDFGAGASSFGYLRQLRIHMLKIDGQFVRTLLDDPLAEATVRCFVDVAAVLGITTVAEFVSDDAILERLRVLGVDYAQGFLLHRPEPLQCLTEVPPAQRPCAPRRGGRAPTPTPPPLGPRRNARNR